MKTADDYAISRHVEKKPLIAASRDTVQTAEDAREIAVKKIDAQLSADERQSLLDATAKAQAQADSATMISAQAQSNAASAEATRPRRRPIWPLTRQSRQRQFRPPVRSRQVSPGCRAGAAA